MAWKSIEDVNVTQKRVLVRVDINVPMEGTRVTDPTRIDRIVPTVRHIVANGGTPVLLAHFGRPKGKPDPALSLRRVQPALEAALGRPVTFVERPSREAIDALPFDTVVLVENTRFTVMEEANAPKMAAFLASLGDLYCNDAFSAAHRAHASTEGVAHLLPSVAGFLMAEELRALEAALGAPRTPVLAVVGGAKVSTKLTLLGNLIEKVDTIVIGGGMANTFLSAMGHEIGTSLAEPDMRETARSIMEKAKARDTLLYIPEDVVVAHAFEAHASSEIVPADACPSDAMILDAGPATIARIEALFANSKTVVWNGPLGAFEIEPFHKATWAAARAAARLTQSADLTTIAGGGDTVAALNGAGVTNAFSYVSTAGGAFLEWMEGKTLPGVAALERESSSR